MTDLSHTKAAKLAHSERIAALDAFDDFEHKLYTCEHGHPDCSVKRGGACTDDIINLLGLED